MPSPLQQPITYEGAQALDINARRATLNGLALPAGQSAFIATGGGSLSISGLTVRNAPGPGITVAVPAAATGTIKVSLLNFTAENNGSHGALINDQAEYLSNPNSTSTDGSAASLEVVVIASRFKENGHTAIDQDGLRINEGGLGGLKVLVSATRVEGNGGDGIEFDEHADGDISFSVSGSALNGNGRFTAADFDDGIDIDEGGTGSIVGNFLLTQANNNFEQGFDINENDVGDIRVDMTLVEALDNSQEGIEYEEDDDVAGGGDIVATLIGIKTRGNKEGDAGLKLREKGAGNLDARLIGIESSGNLVDGVLLREDADGNLTGSIEGASTTGNTGDGIEFDENGAGDLDGTVERANSSDNTVAGIRADQGGTGVGVLRLVDVTTNGNPGGAVVVNAGVTVM